MLETSQPAPPAAPTLRPVPRGEGGGAVPGASCSVSAQEPAQPRCGLTDFFAFLSFLPFFTALSAMGAARQPRAAPPAPTARPAWGTHSPAGSPAGRPGSSASPTHSSRGGTAARPPRGMATASSRAPRARPEALAGSAAEAPPRIHKAGAGQWSWRLPVRQAQRGAEWEGWVEVLQEVGGCREQADTTPFPLGPLCNGTARPPPTPGGMVRLPDRVLPRWFLSLFHLLIGRGSLSSRLVVSPKSSLVYSASPVSWRPGGFARLRPRAPRAGLRRCRALCPAPTPFPAARREDGGRLGTCPVRGRSAPSRRRSSYRTRGTGNGVRGLLGPASLLPLSPKHLGRPPPNIWAWLPLSQLPRSPNMWARLPPQQLSCCPAHNSWVGFPPTSGFLPCPPTSGPGLVLVLPGDWLLSWALCLFPGPSILTKALDC